MSAPPKMRTVRQTFPRPAVADIEKAVRSQFESGAIPAAVWRGKRIAVTAGSRGIANLDRIAGAAVGALKDLGAEPFIIPAMGSHGGGTAEGQRNILAEYGVTDETMGVPVLSSLETVLLGETPQGLPAYMDKNAFESDGVLLLNRVKPHTDFTGTAESGLMKMITVGLGKVDGARAFHARTIDYPQDTLIQGKARLVLETGKILGGLAILENAYHETARLELIPPDAIPQRELELLAEARSLMPSLPVAEADLLIVDRIGKDVSGVGLDPNITGRRYRINRHWNETPSITRIVVLDLTEKTGGNAAGIGLADLCAARVVEKMDKHSTFLNAVTSLNVVCSNIPPHFAPDRELLRQTFLSLGNRRTEDLRVLRIRDTLSLTAIEASESLLPVIKNHPNVTDVSEPREMEFDGEGNLIPLQCE